MEPRTRQASHQKTRQTPAKSIKWRQKYLHIALNESMTGIGQNSFFIFREYL
jgi:hypothetical protein